LDWNFEKKEYCKYWTSYGGDFRAPEEYRGDYVDETVDIWPMGNMIFSLLTGLWPYYNQHDHKDIQKTTMEGIRPYLDPRYQNRSMIEGRLVQIMNLCHELEPSERVDIFVVVKHLRETLRMHEADIRGKGGRPDQGGKVIL
jgi:serine/threonine protein kinase